MLLALLYAVLRRLIDHVFPPQFAPDRIVRADVQELLRRIVVRPDPELSARFPEQHACRVHIRLRDGRTLAREKSDYLGFHTRPAGWSEVGDKFRRLVTPAAGESAAARIAHTVRELEHVRVGELCSLLERVRRPEAGGVEHG